MMKYETRPVNNAVVEPRHRHDLQAVLAMIWELMERGVISRHSAFHTPTVATISKDMLPDVRTVVLRYASKATWTLGFHTDRRSHKFKSLSVNPKISFHVYDAKAKIQVRCWGSVELHVDGEKANFAWQHSRPMSRICYTQVQTPGTTIEFPDSVELQESVDGYAGRKNFVFVEARLHKIEWLHLKANSNTRAMFCRKNEDQIRSAWLAP